MKKLYVLFTMILFSSMHGQEIATTDSGKKVQLNKNGTYKYLDNQVMQSTTLKETDFIKSEQKVMFKKSPYYIINGDEKPTLIQFSFVSDLSQFNSINVDKINSMISTANIKTMYQMKNKSTYVPKKIFCYFNDKDSTWIIATDYIANNDYGGQKDGTSFCIFDNIGTFTKFTTL